MKESMSKLAAGDDAYIKSLATELRVLVCLASGTEGLLWRICEELQVHDEVYVHLAENLDRDHPLAQNLQFLFVPVKRAGTGDPRLVPDHYSLRTIIKECGALVVSGVEYTHENLIRKVAEQMGSAHEDEGVEPHIIELSETILLNQPALIHVFISDAELVLEVGERILSNAAEKGEFIRQNRPATLVSNNPAECNRREHINDFETTMPALPPEGTVMFLVNHHHPDWRTNLNTYDFGSFSNGGLITKAKKHPDMSMEISIDGLANSSISIRKLIPNTNQPGVMIGFTWNGNEVVFYLCGEQVAGVAYRPKECVQPLPQKPTSSKHHH
jgi:hypothetical protein